MNWVARTTSPYNLPLYSYLLSVSLLFAYILLYFLFPLCRFAAPSHPKELNVISSTANSIFLRWKKPLVLNGILRAYLVNISDDRIDNVTQHLDSEIVTYNVTGLRPYTQYRLRVSTGSFDSRTTLHFDVKVYLCLIKWVCLFICLFPFSRWLPSP